MVACSFSIPVSGQNLMVTHFHSVFVSNGSHVIAHSHSVFVSNEDDVIVHSHSVPVPVRIVVTHFRFNSCFAEDSIVACSHPIPGFGEDCMVSHFCSVLRFG